MLINARNYSFKLRDQEIFTWPEHTAIELFKQKPVMGLVRFSDTDAYHLRLIKHVLELETDTDFTQAIAGGATRVNDLQDWDLIEADLINARALKFCSDLMHSHRVRIISAHALVFRDSAYLPPKSPTEAIASIVYLLDPGTEDPDNSSSGKLSFIHRQLEGYTAGELQQMTAGTMIAFPTNMLCTSLPYTGKRPRILLYWQFTQE